MMPRSGTLETRDLILRPLQATDAHGPYASWLRDHEMNRFLEVRFNPPGAAALEGYIARMNDSPDDMLLGLFPKYAAAAHVGNIKIGPIDRRHQAASIGIVLARKYWGKGLALQATRAVSAYAFEALALERLDAGCYGDNEDSRRMFLKAGFVEEGRRRLARRGTDGSRVDEILMGRVRSDPLPLVEG